MKILVDMDGVLADFEKGFLNSYRNRYPDKPFISLEQRSTFYVRDQYLEDLRGLVEGIYNSPQFYLTLPLIDGSLEALKEMVLTHEVYVCTAPLFSNPTCLQDKFDWMMKYFGKDLTKNMIIAKDKTMICGDVLIDDRPEIIGSRFPSWEHILYSQPYNQKINSKRRLNWSNWKSIISTNKIDF